MSDSFFFLFLLWGLLHILRFSLKSTDAQQQSMARLASR